MATAASARPLGDEGLPKKRSRDDESATPSASHKRRKSRAIEIPETSPESQPKDVESHRHGSPTKKSKRAAENQLPEALSANQTNDDPPAHERKPKNKKDKKDKREKKEKNRSEKKKREQDGFEDESRALGRDEVAEDVVQQNEAQPAEEEKKKKKDKKEKDKKDKKEKKEKKAKKQKLEDGHDVDVQMTHDSSRAQRDASADLGGLEPADTTEALADGIYQPAHAPGKPSFPFFTQTVSIFVPIFPMGWDQPLTSACEQHLDPMVNKYNSTYRGVLLGYRNTALNSQPGRSGAAKADDEPTLLQSVDEYAVGYGWLTADVDLFVPSRGAWMEGVVVLQNEGHIGVVCWGKFNASIEASRVPRNWQWIHDPDGADDHDVEMQDESTTPLDMSMQAIHSAGYWVDGTGKRVRGKLRFRIKTFDVGMSGDHNFLSIEGTMLADKEENELRKKEKEREMRRRASAKGGFVYRRVIPEFSMTDFGKKDDEEEAAEAVEDKAATQIEEEPNPEEPVANPESSDSE